MLPYSPASLEAFERDVCYDRYWIDPLTRAVRDADFMTTRYLNCGYAFVMIGRHDAGEGTPRSFFMDGENGGLCHFRRHYFRMALVAHFLKAALLEISDELSESVKLFELSDPGKMRAFQRNTLRIYENFLRFTHRFWFPEISSQVQANELFQMWRRHLRLNELYAEVRQELQDADSFLEVRQQGERAALTGAFERIGIGAAALTTTLAFLSVESDMRLGLPDWGLTAAFFVTLAGSLIVFLALFAGSWKGFKRLRSKWATPKNHG